MKHLALGLTATILAVWISGCAVPLVPTNTQVENTYLYPKMQLLTEVRFTGINPKLPENTKGPELDQVPVLIPAPEAIATRGWFFLPSTQDTAGNSILSINNSGLGNGAWLFGYNLRSDQSTHLIDAAGQFSTVTRLQVQVPSPGAPYARVQAYPLAESAVPTFSRLAVLTQSQTDMGGPNPQLFVGDFPRYCFSDTGTIDTGFGATYSDQNSLPHFDFKAGTFGTYNSTLVISGFSTFPYQIFSLAAYPNRRGVTIMAYDTGGTGLYFYGLIPGSAGSTQNVAANTIFAPFPVAKTYTKTAYSTYDASTGKFSLSSYNPGSTTAFQQLFGNGLIPLALETASNIPIVRTLQDGTALALVNKHWVKVSLDATYGFPTGFGSAINTGTLQFVYDYTDAAGTKWLVFSEAIMLPGTGANNNGNNDNDLLMRSWQIKQDSLIQ